MILLGFTSDSVLGDDAWLYSRLTSGSALGDDY